MASKLTINGLLELNSEVTSRLNRLESLQQQTSIKERTWFGQDLQNKTEKEPQYVVGGSGLLVQITRIEYGSRLL